MRRLPTGLVIVVAVSVASASTAVVAVLISPAALLVNVTAKIELGWTPDASNRAMRAVITRVLPEPAPAKTNNGPSPCSTAACCCRLSRKAGPSSPHGGGVQGFGAVG